MMVRNLVLLTTAMTTVPALAQTSNEISVSDQQNVETAIQLEEESTPLPSEGERLDETDVFAGLQDPRIDPTINCELHIWPTTGISSVSSGWLSGFGPIGALADLAQGQTANERRAAVLQAMLDPPTQLTLLAGMDLRTLLNVPPANIYLHREIIESEDADELEARRTESESQCYSELYVTRVFFQKRALYGRSLQVRFGFRDFGNQPGVQMDYFGNSGNGISHFPPEDESELELASEEMRTVFQANFEEFANNVRRRQERQRR